MTTKAKMNVPIAKPFFGPEEAEAVRKVLESGWVIQGPKTEEFEGLAKAITGTTYAKACSSCTTALHMSLLALGVGPGDKVLVPAYTFVASANAAEYCGAIPILVDIDLPTFNIDPQPFEALARAIQGKWRDRKLVAMPVHLFGLCANMPRILKVTKQLGIPVVEDAACALGATCPSGTAGGMSEAGCHSYHPRKPVTTGEGGTVMTNDEEIARKVHALRDFGFSITNIERHKSGATLMPKVEVLGYNYRMTDIQATIGVEQLKKWDVILVGKRRVAAVYDKELVGLEWLKTPTTPEGYTHTYQSYACLVGGNGYKADPAHIDRWGEVRIRLMEYLKDRGVMTRQGTHAVHMLDYYARKYGYKPLDFINTYAADKMCITIPLFPQMTELEQEYVIEALREFKV